MTPLHTATAEALQEREALKDINTTQGNEQTTEKGPQYEMLYYAERYGGLNPNRARELYALMGDLLEK